VNRIDIGYRSPSSQAAASRSLAARDVPAESLMLTGDENIIDINFSVFWHISNAPDYLFNTRNPAETVKSAAESVMREVIGHTPIQPALTEARASIEQQVRDGTQAILTQYGAGVEVTQVQLQRVDPPAAVIDSFRDVQRANTDAERMRNEAEAYRNDIVPRARGDAAAIVAQADGAKQASIAQATGESQRFLSVLSAYQAAKDITLKRLYIETMQAILSRAQTTVLDDNAKNLIPYLPLNQAQPAPAPADKGAAQ
jgi:modulator of FtsH protease HflK